MFLVINSYFLVFSFLCLSSTLSLFQTKQIKIQNLDQTIINIHQPKSRNQHTPTKIENPEINIHQQSNLETDLHIQKF
ncbi:hypothetical protein ACB098_06G047200 [Castanea mollissima]